MRAVVALLASSFCVLLLAACPKKPPPQAELGAPLLGLSQEHLDRFQKGKVLFQRKFTPETGLGPLFNADACGECHEDPVAGGAGDETEVQFILQLNETAAKMFGSDYGQKQTCSGAGFTFDFFFPEEKTAVEFAFGLHNPISEFERDIFKCLLAIDEGCAIDKLLFIAKPGALSRQSAPGPKAIMRFAEQRFGLAIEILELERFLRYLRQR